MLVVSRPFVVSGANCPSVAVDSDVLGSHVDHWLDADAHAWTKEWTDASATIVRNIWILVKTSADAMTCEFADYCIASLLAVFLDSISDMTYAIAGLGLLDTDKKALLGCTQQSENLLVNITYREGVTAVAIETIDDCTAVATNDITIL